MRRIMMGCLVALMACSKATAPEPTVTGAWSGTMAGFGPVALSLNDLNGIVRGSGTIGSGASAFAVTVDPGAFTPPLLWIVLTPGTGRDPIIVYAKVDGDFMVADISGTGFNVKGVSLTR